MEKRKNIEISRRDFLKGAVALGATSAMEIGFPTVILSKTTEEKDYVIKLGYYNCDHMIAAPVAYETGIFERFGLKVELTGTGKVPEAMAAGQMDVGYIGFTGMVRAIFKGSPMNIVAHNHMGGSMYIIVKKEIKKPEELVGKKLGIGASPEKHNEMWIWFARTAGIPVEGKYYECFNMSDKDEYLALKTGHLDGFFACDPWGSMAEYENTGYIMHAFGALPSGTWGICCSLVMNKTFIKNRPRLAVKIIQAHIQSLQMIYTQPLRAARIFAKYYSVPEEVSMMSIYKKTIGETRTLTWKITRKGFDEEAKHNVSLGVFEKAPKWDEIVNMELIREAMPPDFDVFIKEKVDPIFPLGMSYQDWKKKAIEIDKKTS